MNNPQRDIYDNPSKASPDKETDGKTIVSTFVRFKQRLRRMAASITGNEDDADDILQDAFAKMWVGRDSIKDKDHAAAFLTTTVKHLSIDNVRDKQRHPNISMDEERDAQADDPADEAREREMTFSRIERIIEEELPSLTREIMKRHEYKGESYDDIAHELKMQPAAVRMQISRARKAIRELYKKQTT